MSNQDEKQMDSYQLAVCTPESVRIGSRTWIFVNYLPCLIFELVVYPSRTNPSISRGASLGVKTVHIGLDRNYEARRIGCDHCKSAHVHDLPAP